MSPLCWGLSLAALILWFLRRKINIEHSWLFFYIGVDNLTTTMPSSTMNSLLSNATDGNSVIRQTKEYIQEKFSGEGTGHDWWHIERVWRNAILIGGKESVDMFVVQLAALLHDIADWKFHGGNESVGPRMAREWLESLSVNEKVISHVCEITAELSFKGAGYTQRMKTREGMVVQDADRLDALGAIGIARAFAYGGYKGRGLYNPDVQPEYHTSFEQYKNNSGPTINHFYEKLLLLKDLMNTPTAREMAEERHAFMEEFLERFFKEWKGE